MERSGESGWCCRKTASKCRRHCRKAEAAKEKKDKYISGIIIPKFKPGTYVSEDQLELLKELEKEKEIVVKRVDGIIIPKNKPLIVHKKRLSTTKKSKYYSDRDLNYARQAVAFMEKSNWKDALKVAKKARAKSIYNFIQWRHLLTPGNRATFYNYKSFIESDQTYPRLSRVKYLAEHKLSTKNE